MSILKKLLALPVAAALMASVALIGVGTASAQTMPTLAIQMQTAGISPVLNAGDTGDTLAVIRLDTTDSSEAIRLLSLPLILTTGNGASGANLTSCHIVNANNTAASFNTGVNSPAELISGTNNFNFDSPLIISQGGVVTLDLLCNVTGPLTAGGTYTFSINTASVSATGATTGDPAVVSAGTASPVVSPVVPIVGLPNTGAGGNAAENVAIILGALILAGLGIAYARKATATS